MSTPSMDPLESHRRHMFWQIWLPLVLVLLLAVAAVVFTLIAASGTGDISVWSSISVIWLVIPWLGVLFLNLLFVGAAIFFLPRFIRRLPGWALIARVKLAEINAAVLGLAVKVTTPVVEMKSRMAGIRSALARLRKPCDGS